MDPPNAVILESVFETLLNALRTASRHGHSRLSRRAALAFWGGALFGFNAFRHNPADDAASLSCPALFLHGADDPRATLPQARRVFDAARGPKQFIVF
jgi:pimeloyl-ACP methyl ester carboxylesterase